MLNYRTLKMILSGAQFKKKTKFIISFWLFYHVQPVIKQQIIYVTVFLAKFAYESIYHIVCLIYGDTERHTRKKW